MLAKSLTLIIILLCADSLSGEWRLFRRNTNYSYNYRQICVPQTQVIKPQVVQNLPSVKKPPVLSTPSVYPNLGRDYSETNNKAKDLQNQNNVVEQNNNLSDLVQVEVEVETKIQFDNDQFTPLRHKTDVYHGHQTLLKKPSTVLEMVPFTKFAK